MKKQDLKTGMLVLQNDGSIAMVINEVLVEQHSHTKLIHYNDDLTSSKFDSYSIKMVSNVLKENLLRPDNWTQNTIDNNLLWNREEDIPELTMQEAIKKIGFEFKIVKE